MTKTEYGKKRRPFVSTQIILLCASSTTAFRAQQLPRSPPLLSYNSPTAQKPRGEPGIYLLAPSAVLSRISRELFICYFPLTCGHSMGNAQITESASSVWLLGSRPWRRRESVHSAGKTGMWGLLAKVWEASRPCRQLSPELWLLLHLN